MKTKFFIYQMLILGFSLLNVSHIFAQNDTISNTDLKNYAFIQDSLKQLKTELVQELSAIIAQDTIFQKGLRYQDWKSHQADSSKMAELAFSSEEIAACEEIHQFQKEETQKIQRIYLELIINQIGQKKFEQIRDGLQKDPNLQARYLGLQEDTEPKEDDASNDKESPSKKEK